MTSLLSSLTVLVALVGIFMLGTRLGERRCPRVGLLGYLVPVLFSVVAFTVAAHGSDSNIWQMSDGTYTDMPERYSGEAVRFTPSRDRLTPVMHQSSYKREWSTLAAVRVVPGAERCVGVYLGNTVLSGGVAVCRGERAVISQERVRRRGKIVTTTDTVLTVSGRELIRIRGRSAEHNPSRTVRRE